MKTESYSILVNNNIKPSLQRLAIMDYLLEHRTHPTVDEIYLALCDEIPTLSKTTVYNTLKLFVEQGAALMLTIDERRICFDGDTSLHSHFFCRRCGRVLDVPYSGKKRLPSAEELNGHKAENVHQYYWGICKTCLENECAMENN